MSTSKKPKLKGTQYGVSRHGNAQQVAVAGTAVAEVLRRIEEIDAARPVSTGCQLIDLTERTCRWPIGDPGTPSFYFCGADHEPVDGPYCQYHAKVAFKNQP